MVNVSLSFQSVDEMLAFFGNRDVGHYSGTKTIAETVNRECAEPHTSAKAETPAAKAETPAAKAETPAAKAETPAAKAETPAAKAEPILASDPDMAADYQEKPVVYRDVAEAINALVVKNRAKAVEVLASFGVKKGTELEPKGVSLAKALEALTAALDED